MAIIPTLPGYQVEIIKTTNEPFPEHPDNGENEWPREYETPHKALQFVECVSGAPFQIHLQLRSKVNFKGSSILIKVVIAGMTVAALQVNRKHFGKNGEYSTDCKGAYSRSSPTQTELRPFIFTELEKGKLRYDTFHAQTPSYHLTHLLFRALMFTMLCYVNVIVPWYSNNWC